jgi:hypothetical protein
VQAIGDLKTLFNASLAKVKVVSQHIPNEGSKGIGTIRAGAYNSRR